MPDVKTTDDNTGYRPVSCARYSEYELAIMHRQQLRIAWRDPDGAAHLELLTPLDLETRRGEEFLIAVNGAGERLRLRLDRIFVSTAGAGP